MSSETAPPPLIDDAAAPSAPQSAVALDVDTVELARAVAVAAAGSADHVGDFIAAIAEDDIAVTASFVARQPGYADWHWSVTLALLPPGSATISEVVLLPGEGALLAPAWIPWDQRIRPGDVGVGDLLPPIDNDPRLVPAYVQSDDPAVEEVAHELGIGRVHVLSREGRVDFAERLHDSDFGPAGDIALAAPARCFSCAFYLPLAGSLGRLVGGCGNEYSPAEGRVVDAGFGCGAHSETVIEMPARSATTLAVIDELSLEVHRRPEPAVVPAPGSDLPDNDAWTPAVDQPNSFDSEPAVDVSGLAIDDPEPAQVVSEPDGTDPEPVEDVLEPDSIDVEPGVVVSGPAGTDPEAAEDFSELDIADPAPPVAVAEVTPDDTEPDDFASGD